mmetsp:Transcript_16599/g.45928  ORF Transcript_16599/g.45928 Transcript_16599/m.45928 type:complete len:156 (-) Transcript_16599:113-580(-)
MASSSTSCRDYGLQQRIAGSCGAEVTAFMRCCDASDLTFRDAFPSPPSSSPCAPAHEAVARCVAQALSSGRGGAYDSCARDFAAAQREGLGDTEASAAVFRRSWACAWRHFGAPLKMLLVTSEAMGECRSSGVPFRDTETANEAKFRGAWAGTAL